MSRQSISIRPTVFCYNMWSETYDNAGAEGRIFRGSLFFTSGWRNGRRTLSIEGKSASSILAPDTKPIRMFKERTKKRGLARSERPRGIPTYTGVPLGRINPIVLRNYVRGGIRYSEKRREELRMYIIIKHPEPMRKRVILAANRFIDRLKIFTDY